MKKRRNICQKKGRDPVLRRDKKYATMWMCVKYGTSMVASHADDFCARRFAAANRKGGSAVVGFSHCRTCRRGAAVHKVVGAGGGKIRLKKEIAAGQSGRISDESPVYALPKAICNKGGRRFHGPLPGAQKNPKMVCDIN